MIKLRKRPPVPPELLLPKVSKRKKYLEQIINNANYPSSKDFTPYWRGPVKTAIWGHHRGKCCYCERKRDNNRESDVEHFRPKTEIKDAGKPGYWWLAYEWKNYLFACKTCNEDHKITHFPLLPHGQRSTGERTSLADEHPILINPIDENPEDFIEYSWFTIGKNGLLVKMNGTDPDGRGEQTITIAGLNRTPLMRERATRIRRMDLIIEMVKIGQKHPDLSVADLARDMIQDLTSGGSKFAGFHRAYFRAAGFDAYVSTN